VGGCGCGDERGDCLELLPAGAPGLGEESAVVRRDARVDGEGGKSSLGEDECGEAAGALLVAGDEYAVVQAAERRGGDGGLLGWVLEREVFSARKRVTNEVSRRARLTRMGRAEARRARVALPRGGPRRASCLGALSRAPAAWRP
jgi:hypothetical protein